MSWHPIGFLLAAIVIVGVVSWRIPVAKEIIEESRIQPGVGVADLFIIGTYLLGVWYSGGPVGERIRFLGEGLILAVGIIIGLKTLGLIAIRLWHWHRHDTTDPTDHD